MTEDCGFLESFQPWYTYERASDKKEENKKDKKEKKSKKEKNSDAEEEPVEKGVEEQATEQPEEDDEDAEKYSQASTDENYEKIGDDVNKKISEFRTVSVLGHLGPADSRRRSSSETSSSQSLSPSLALNIFPLKV